MFFALRAKTAFCLSALRVEKGQGSFRGGSSKVRLTPESHFRKASRRPEPSRRPRWPGDGRGTGWGRTGDGRAIVKSGGIMTTVQSSSRYFKFKCNPLTRPSLNAESGPKHRRRADTAMPCQATSGVPQTCADQAPMQTLMAVLIIIQIFGSLGLLSQRVGAKHRVSRRSPAHCKGALCGRTSTHWYH